MQSISLRLFPNKILHSITRNIKSALYITGDKAQHMFVSVHPHVDFEKTLNVKNKLLDDISRRGLSIDLERLEKRYYFFKTIKEKQSILEETRDEINDCYAETIKESPVNVEQLNKLKLHKEVVREELRSMKDFLYGLEENVMLSILNLPNILHEASPNEDEVIHDFLEKPCHTSESHVDIGLKSNVLKFVDNWGCYLKSDASLFEIAISNYFINNLMTLKFSQFQNADLTRSIIVEGCGKDVVNNSEVLTIYEPNAKNELQELSRLHLTGSASTYAFMAYFAKHIVQNSYFPLKYFCYGRSYNGDLRKNDNLFNLNQESVLNVFIAALDDDAWSYFKIFTDDIKKMYDALGYHYRLVYLEPSKLNRNESHKLSIQMFSNQLQNYVEVGYLSYYDSYISERLLFTCLQGKENIFPKIIAGNILNVPKMLGCVLENSSATSADIVGKFLRTHLP